MHCLSSRYLPLLRANAVFSLFSLLHPFAALPSPPVHLAFSLYGASIFEPTKGAPVFVLGYWHMSSKSSALTDRRLAARAAALLRGACWGLRGEPGWPSPSRTFLATGFANRACIWSTPSSPSPSLLLLLGRFLLPTSGECWAISFSLNDVDAAAFCCAASPTLALCCGRCLAGHATTMTTTTTQKMITMSGSGAGCVNSEEELLWGVQSVPHRFRTDVRMRYSPSSPNSESEGVGPVNEKVPAQTHRGGH